MKSLLSPTRILPVLSLSLGLTTHATAQKIAVTGGTTDHANAIVAARLPAGLTSTPNTVALPDGTHVPAQITASWPGQDNKTKYLVFVLPKLKAGETVEVTPTMLNYIKAPPQFKFVDEKDKPTELLFDKRPVLQYFNLPHDPKDHFYTFKPFHNVFDPATGKTMLTNSSATTNKDGLYPHHRGLFFGFNRISYGDKQTADIWHGTDNVFSTHDKTLAAEAGEVLGRQRAEVSWHGKDSKTFATETREVTAYATPGGTTIDWNTVLSTKLDKVRLDGDPQHAGFHFRANMDVADAVKAEETAAKKENRKPKPADTYYLRPDGKGKLGDTRNWDPSPKAAISKDPRTVNLPWNAMSFVVGGKRYTVLRINHPDNLKETRGSERDYGRFGDYIEYDLTPDKPLKLKYRVWVQEGEMTVDQCNALAAAFVSPPATKNVAGK